MSFWTEHIIEKFVDKDELVCSPIIGSSQSFILCLWGPNMLYLIWEIYYQKAKEGPLHSSIRHQLDFFFYRVNWLIDTPSLSVNVFQLLSFLVHLIVISESMKKHKLLALPWKIKHIALVILLWFSWYKSDMIKTK